MNFRTDTPIEGIHEELYIKFVNAFLGTDSVYDLFPMENEPEKYERWIEFEDINEIADENGYTQRLNLFPRKSAQYERVKITITMEQE